MTGEGHVGDPTVIGRRLRHLRGERGLSLRRLARLIGVSPSLLSQIENGHVSPSVDTLYQLAGALDTPVAGFFAEARPDDWEGASSAGDVWVVRRDERQRIGLEHGVSWENLLPREQSGLRFVEVRYPPGAHSGEHFLREPGRHLVLVVAGELVVRVAFGEHVVHAGDALGFAGSQPYHLRNDGRTDAVAVVCVIGEGAPDWRASDDLRD